MDIPAFHTSAALLYSVVILLSPLSADRRMQFVIPFLAVWMSLYFSASPLFAAQASLYIALTGILTRLNAQQKWLRVILYGVWGILTIGLLLHALPGYEGLRLADDIQLKPNSLPVSVYLNTDKVLVAWSLILMVKNRKVSTHKHMTTHWLIWCIVPAGVTLILTLANAMNLVAWQPGFSALLGIIIISNLINTCITEELIFRAGLQRWLQQKTGAITGLFIASTLFGFAHFSGGYAYIMLATLAGILYGAVYMVSGKLRWAVLCHWGLNTTHMTLFTWPMIQPG